MLDLTEKGGAVVELLEAYMSQTGTIFGEIILPDAAVDPAR